MARIFQRIRPAGDLSRRLKKRWIVDFVSNDGVRRRFVVGSKREAINLKNKWEGFDGENFSKE